VHRLRLSPEFRKVEIFSLWAWPIAGEDAWVCPRWLSIKLDGQGEDCDRDVGVEEAMHVDCC